MLFRSQGAIGDREEVASWFCVQLNRSSSHLRELEALLQSVRTMHTRLDLAPVVKRLEAAIVAADKEVAEVENAYNAAFFMKEVAG